MVSKPPLQLLGLALGLALFVTARAAALGEPSPAGPGEARIVISEVHFHPPGDLASEEFVELANVGVHWVDVSHWRFVRGIDYELPPGTVIEPGGHLAIARNAAALSRRADRGRVIGDFEGRLANDGEVLELVNRVGRTVLAFRYRDGKGGDAGEWPERPDGRGSSLELIAPHSEWEDPWRWAASVVVGGTPGRPNSVEETVDDLAAPARSRSRSRARGAAEEAPSEHLSVRLSELATAGAEPFVEIVNEGRSTVRLDGWVVTLEAGKDEIARIDLGGTLASRRLEMRALNAASVASVKRAVLRVPSGAAVDALEALDAERAARFASVGRTPASGGVARFVRASPGRPNGELEGPDLVINEIYYHGLDSEGRDEFVELHNPGRSPVDLEGWELSGGVRFRFPAGARIDAEGFVVVAKDPELLARRLTGVPASLVFGPFAGSLSNRGERVELEDSAGREVDRVRYGDRGPWPRDADGQGASLELRHPAIDNSYGAAWTRGGPGGSPGAANRHFQALVPPVVARVSHSPAVAEPGGTVVFHARIVGTREPSEVRVVYRLVGAEAKPSAERLSDRGRDDDGEAGDGHWAGSIKLSSRVAPGAVIAYRLVGRAAGRAFEHPEGGQELFLPVDRQDRADDGAAVYRFLLGEAAAERFAKQSRSSSDWYSGTFVASAEGAGIRDGRGVVFHGASIRLRGNNSRRPPDGRMSYRVRLAEGESFGGRDRLVLNAYASYRQKAGGDVIRQAGVPVPRLRTIRLVVPGQDDRRYLDVQVVDRSFIEDRWLSSDGDLFRGFRGNPAADLGFHGREAPERYRAVYRRQNRKEVEDIEPLLDLLEALDTKDDEVWWKEVSARADVPQWATYLAANIVLGNVENGLARGVADDFFLCRRPTDGRFVLVSWDHDSTFTNTRRSLFKPALPAVRRFLTHPRVGPIYHRRVAELLEGPLGGVGWTLSGLGMAGRFPAERLRRLEAFVHNRQIWLREAALSPGTAWVAAEGGGKGASGQRLFTSAQGGRVLLHGVVDRAAAFELRVDGESVPFSVETGEWEHLVELTHAATPVWVEELGLDASIAASRSLRVERVGALRAVPEVLRGSIAWSADEGPYYIGGETLLGPGSTLTIGPGTQIVAAADAVLVVRGRLEAVGEALRPIAWRPESARRPWRGLRFERSGGAASRGQRLVHCRFEGGRGNPPRDAPPDASEASRRAEDDPETDGLASDPRAFVLSDRVDLSIEACLFRDIHAWAVAAFDAELEVSGTTVVDGRHGVRCGGGARVVDLEVRGVSGIGILVDGASSDRVELRGASVDRAQHAGIVVRGRTVSVDGARSTRCGVGLDVAEGARVEGREVFLVSDGVGLLVDRRVWEDDAAPAAPRPSRVELQGGAVCPNGVEVLASSRSRVSLASCRSLRTREAGAVSVRDTLEALPELRAPERGDYRPR